jgi:hypothetical protein
VTPLAGAPGAVVAGLVTALLFFCCV